MRFVSWNVNGLRAAVNKGFLDVFNDLDADFFCVQETKLQKEQIKLELDNYEQYWCCADKKGYSGTAIFTKFHPISVRYNLGIDEHDHEGRTITLEYETFFIVCVYTPNSQDGLKRLDYRMRWEDSFRHYVEQLSQSKTVIICGDLNVAYQEIDIANPNSNHNNPGFSDQERSKFGEILSSGFVDSFRYLEPCERKYSWWSYRMKARERNVGWRIDYFLVSGNAKNMIRKAEIHNDYYGSDHCPISLEIDL